MRKFRRQRAAIARGVLSVNPSSYARPREAIMKRIGSAAFGLLAVLALGLALLSSPVRAATPVAIVTGITDIHSPLAMDANYLYFGTRGGALSRVSRTGANLQQIANIGSYIYGITVHDGYI